jgi:hypothetical protein
MLLDDGIGFQDGEDSFLEVTMRLEFDIGGREGKRRGIEIPGQ